LKNGLAILAMLLVMSGAVLGEACSWAVGKQVALGAVLLFVALESGALLKGARIMLAVCLISSLAILTALPDAVGILSQALENAAFIIGLFAAVSLLREPAERSALVRRCGDLLIQQPPGRRFLVLSLGSLLISVVLNFGVLALLGPMTLNANTLEAAGGDPNVIRIRKQRMMSAVLQGFALMTVWSPLSVSFAVTQVAIPGLSWAMLVPLQMLLCALLLGLAWLVDHFTFRRYHRTDRIYPPQSWAPAGRLMLLVGTIVTAALTLSQLLAVRPVIGSMIIVPLSALIWLWVQDRGPLIGLAGRVCTSLPSYRNEYVLVGGAIFCGILATNLLEPATVTALLLRLALPPIAVMVLMVWTMMALARFGMPQIVTVTVLGHALAGLSAHGIQPLVMASGFMGGWALSACTTQVGAAVLAVARMSDVSISTVARLWNGRFVLCGALLLALWMLVLNSLLEK